MHLAFIPATARGAVDATLCDIARALARQGRRLAGVVQDRPDAGGRHRCDRDLRDLSHGRRLSISQALGSGSTACRLDPAALEVAAAEVAAGFDRDGAELLIVNRFGKLEAAGRGFCPLIVRALEGGIPVLVGVNDVNRPAFDDFAAGLAVELRDDVAAVLVWARARLQRAAA